MRDFSEILNEALEKQERNKAWLSSKTGISAQAIGDYCKGKAIPSFDRAMLIAKVLNIDFSECYGGDELNDMTAKDGSGKYVTQIPGKEGVIEVPLFPHGSDLLSSLQQSSEGYSIDVSMARENTVAEERLAHEGVFAVQTDHLFDCDEKYGTIFVWPWEGSIKENGIILFTVDPPKQFFLRRVMVYESGKFVLKKSYQESNVVREDDIIILGEVKFRGEWT